MVVRAWVAELRRSSPLFEPPGSLLALVLIILFARRLSSASVSLLRRCLRGRRAKGGKLVACWVPCGFDEGMRLFWGAGDARRSGLMRLSHSQVERAFSLFSVKCDLRARARATQSQRERRWSAATNHSDGSVGRNPTEFFVHGGAHFLLLKTSGGGVVFRFLAMERLKVQAPWRVSCFKASATDGRLLCELWLQLSLS